MYILHKLINMSGLHHDREQHNLKSISPTLNILLPCVKETDEKCLRILDDTTVIGYKDWQINPSLDNTEVSQGQ